MEFRKLLLEKIQQLEREKGDQITSKQFAQYLGVKQSILSHWMNGKYKPSLKSVKILAEKLGPKVYDSLGYCRPDPNLKFIVNHWEYLPSDTQHHILETIEKYKTSE